MASIYDQVPLRGSNSIRLLKLFPASSTNDIVKCDLLEVALDQRPVFKAVSYSWDGQAPTEKASCSGQSIFITPNCNNVLRHIAAASNAPALVWIDAICINQSPTAMVERNQQVSIMGQIYSAAEEVVVWLGTKIEPSWEEAFRNVSLFTAASLQSDSENYSKQLLELAGKIDTKCELTSKRKGG